MQMLDYRDVVTDQPTEDECSGQLESDRPEPRHRADGPPKEGLDHDEDYQGRHVTPSWWKWFSKDRGR